MIRLLVVSLVWAFSFGLIKHQLVGIHPDLVNAVRLGMSVLVFVPWLVRRPPAAGVTVRLVAVGAIQFGLMYAAYTRAFAYLAGHQVALATILTPLYVSLFDDLLERRIRWRFLGAAVLSVIGTALGTGVDRLEGAWTGLGLLQLSNLSFAVGQVWYRRVVRASPEPLSDAGAMAWAYVGGAAITALAAGLRLAGLPAITGGQWLALAWLGVVASALCFFLWNSGARAVNTGVLAVMNDVKIPLGLVVSLFVFGETTDAPRLLAGCTLVAVAWWFAWRTRTPAPARVGEADAA
jgi:drug/metabolite transporter (DMT)-like permease